MNNIKKIYLIIIIFFLALFYFYFIGSSSNYNTKITINNSSDYNTKITINNSTFGDIYNMGNTIIIRTPENFVKQSSAKKHLENFINSNISTIILLVKNDDDLKNMDSGEVFYKSKIAPIAKDYKKFNFDALNYTINFAHKNNIKVFAWIPQFHDKSLIKKDNNLQMKYFVNGEIKNYNPNGEYFVNPISIKVQNYELSIIKEILDNYNIDGIFLDWIRFDNYNMDLGNETQNKFYNKFKLNLSKIDFSTDNKNRRVWNNFREDEISSYIKKVSKLVKKKNENIILGTFILPIEMHEVAQNPNKFENYIDLIGIMLYSNDWGFTEDWIFDKALFDLKKNLNNDYKILPVFDLNMCNKNKNRLLNLNIYKESCFNYFDWDFNTLNSIY